MITNSTKQGWGFHPVRALQIVKEQTMSLIKRLTQVVSAEELDSSTSRLHLG